MTDIDDPLFAELTHLDAPPLDEAYAARVRAYARGELLPASSQGQWARRLRSIRWDGALIPALLMSAVLSFTAQTARTVAAVYAGHGQPAGLVPSNP